MPRAAAPGDDLARRLCRAGASAALVFVAIQTAVYLPDALLFEHELHLLDADGDFSIWAWGNASTIFVGALAGVLLALTVQRALVKVYAGIAATLTFLSLDETVGIHERLTNDVPSLLGVPDYYARVIWPAVYLPLLATVAMLLIVAARRLAPAPHDSCASDCCCSSSRWSQRSSRRS